MNWHILQKVYGIFIPEIREKKYWKDVCKKHLSYRPDISPKNGKGHMATIEMFYAPRPPPQTHD